MTKKQKEAYLKNPYYCPFCKAKDIYAGKMESDGSDAWTTVECQSCKKTWKDAYTLTDIREI